MVSGINNPYAGFFNSPAYQNTPNTNTTAAPAPLVQFPQNQTQQTASAKLKLNLAQLALSFAMIAAMFFVLPKILTKSLQKGIRISESELQAMWQSLSDAAKIKDMALPESLEKLAQKIKTNIENPDLTLQRGGKPITSMLLYGPPGTGKTSFAKALAKMFPNSEFASFNLAVLHSEFHGGTEKNINAAVDMITAKAKSNPDKKIFVLVDEIDTVIMVDTGKNAKLSNNILNEFKKCFTEKLGKYDNIITIGTTNLEIDTQKATANGKMLDKPMLDRFEEKVLVDFPTAEQIKQSMIAHYKDCAFVSDELKTDNKRLDALCNLLSNKEHSVSFRTMNSIYSDTAASIKDDTSKVTLDDIIETLKAKASELNLTETDLLALASV